MAPSPVKTKRRVVLVDDHPLLRQGIGQLINQEPDLEVCGEVEDRAGALKVIHSKQPDLALVDLTLKNDRGLELIKDLRVQHPNVLILVLSMHEEALYAERVLRAGARGYIMKREAADKVLEAIRNVLAGSIYVSGAVAERILKGVADTTRRSDHPSLANLTDREFEVLMLIGKGHGNQQIARQLHISVKTVETHRAHLREKLQLRSGNELLRHAIHWAQQAGEL
jgi:DNA-binding NarL/FixJ family response regulator